MYPCPCCDQETIGFWKKLSAKKYSPATCSSCGGLSYVPVRYTFLPWLYGMVLAILVWITAIKLKSGWPLWGMIPVVIWTIRHYLKHSSLVKK